MRNVVMLLALAGLAACHPQAEKEEPAKPAALTYEGGDYKDEAAKLAHGERLATILDCTGCHKSNLQGQNVTARDPSYGEMNAPNITLLLAKYSDDDFRRLLRDGVPKDGREFWFMPVESLQFLSDADLDAVIAYLRTFKPEGTQLPPIKKGKGFQEDLERGFGNSQQQVARYKAEPPPDLGPQHEFGRYLVQTTCTSCHNSKLQGYEGFTPNLNIAGTYSEAELTRLLTTGEGKVKKDLGMMSDVARNHFSRFTPKERSAIVSYILDRAERMQEQVHDSSRD
ncbi:cytochrome c [Sphingomonas sp. RB56-2]|uniref:Cytochrome c n=1 Tax=Sphingomonas brevis TaxID=2908206 RepID=A0ABT0S9F9_9SPHN|nr:cytochrome c [Sphingomonas brevis]MCL6740765.1 cytochrome c [Sphingomonas brevis]